MLDIRLASKLVAAVAPKAHLVLVGDVDQLPPVGAGQTLREVIASGVPEIVRLREVFRQAQESAIIRGAHAILAGHIPEPTPQGTRGTGDLFLVPAEDPDPIVEKLLGVLRRLRDAYGFDPLSDVQVLAPTRRGPLGTERLNEVLQNALNPGANDARPGAFRPGDKVMQLRNDYDREVFNGDLGTIRRIEGGITYALVEGREVQYPVDELDALSLAYASTVHKVQGSEFPAVVIVLHTSHYMLLSRPMLYTAVTRAKRVAVLVGSPKAIGLAARNAESAKTASRLQARLRAAADPSS
jgi:exodeoxyribonuclease V alpha subunit